MDLDQAALRGIGELTLVLEREGRLVGELHRAVMQQRDAVSRGDQEGVESSLRLSGRALLTLQETRRHRGTLLHRLVGDPAQPLAELDARFESPLPAPFLAARERIQSAAAGLAEEIWRNQETLLGALRKRDALLQELLTGTRPTPPAAELPGATAEA
jgi:hypothetical protein